MFRKSNFKELKTTLLGLLLLVAAIAYPFLVSSANVWIFGIMACVGVSFLFLPDTLLSSIKKLIETNSEKKF
jgi:uncharacterized membrane protein